MFDVRHAIRTIQFLGFCILQVFVMGFDVNLDIVFIIRLVVARITSKPFQIEVNCFYMLFKVWIISSFESTRISVEAHLDPSRGSFREIQCAGQNNTEEPSEAEEPPLQ